jgi:hypothetical protein
VSSCRLLVVVEIKGVCSFANASREVAGECLVDKLQKLELVLSLSRDIRGAD